MHMGAPPIHFGWNF